MSYWIRLLLTIAAVSAVLVALWSVINIVILVLMSAGAGDRPGSGGSWIERRGRSRGRAVTMIFLGALAIVILFASLVIPPLVTQVGELADDIPGYVERLSRRDDALGRYFQENDVADQLQRFVKDLPEQDHELLRDDRRRRREGRRRALQRPHGGDPHDLLHALAPSGCAVPPRSGSRRRRVNAPKR